MAKLYAELSGTTGRKVSKSDNTRLEIELYNGNTLIGTVGLYHIHSTGGYRVIYDKFGEGFNPNKPAIDEFNS